MRKKTDFPFFAITAPGLENICARELGKLGIAGVRPVSGGVEFSGGLRELYLANLWLRTASRILVRIGEFKCRDFPALHRKTLHLPWGSFIRPGTPIQVRASSHASRLMHTDRLAETVEDAIRHSLGKSQAEVDTPLQTILIRIDNDRCLLSIDSSGELLHRRGYREQSVAAPLRETLAAGLLNLLKWKGDVPLLDPMCGSGTFSIEAALLATRRAPGAHRPFAFMNWPHFREGLWKNLLGKAEKEIETLSPPIYASDIAARAVEATRCNAQKAGVLDFLSLELKKISQLTPLNGPGLIICNPPYGKRLEKNHSTAPLYREMGKIFGNSFKGWTLAMICPAELSKATGLSLKKKGEFTNGGIKIYLFKTLL